MLYEVITDDERRGHEKAGKADAQPRQGSGKHHGHPLAGIEHGAAACVRLVIEKKIA